MQRSPRAVPGSAAPFDATRATGGVVLLRQHGPPEREAWTDPRLAVPPLPPRLVSRPRLLDVLDAAVARAALTLVTSEPDGGKTVLLAEWARRRPDPAAWLALSRADNDPLRFWSPFLRAVGAPGSFPLPTTWSGRAVPGLLDSLFGRDRPAAAPAAVVLDDAHVLTERHVLDGLDRVISRWSARVRLVIASRSVPLLPIHRYRLAGQLAELGTGDLARTAEEAVELLRAHGVSLTGEELARLTARTAHRGVDRGAAARGTADGGQPRLVPARDRVGDGPRQHRRVPRRRGPLDAAAARPPAARRHQPSRRGERRVRRGDHGDPGLRTDSRGTGPHQLLRRSARLVLHPLPVPPAVPRGPALSGPATRRPRDAEHRPPGDRVVPPQRRHQPCRAVRGGDPALARSVLVRGGLAQAFVAGQDLAAVADDELLETDAATDGEAAEMSAARLAVAAVRAQSAEKSSVSDGARAGTLEVVAGAADAEHADPELRVTAEPAAALLARSRGDDPAFTRAIEDLLADDLSAAVAAVPGLRGKALLLQARGSFLAGRLADVEPLLDRALAAAEAGASGGVQLEILGVQALVNVSAGRPRHSDEALARATDVLSRDPDLLAPVTLDVAVARRAYVEADLATMADAMHRALAAGPIYRDRAGAASVALLQAMLLVAMGEPEQAGQWLHAPVLDGPGLGMLAVYRDCELGGIEIALGRPQQALTLLQPYEKSPFALTAAVPAALARLGLGDPDGAERTLRPVLTTPSTQVDRYLLVTALLCQAQIALHRGDVVCALDCVTRARELAGEDIVVSFVRATAALAPLFARHPDAAADWPAPVAAPAQPTADAPGYRLPEPLTERELAVLRLLATTMSPSEIAAELVVSVNTVKTHLAAVYRKLGVGRRRDAVRSARELELL